MSESISDTVADQLFRTARTVREFTDRPVDDTTLAAAWDLAKWGPTAMNISPLRLMVVRTPDSRKRLADHVSPGNKDRVLAAPVTLVLATDHEFHQHLPRLAPHMPGQQERLAEVPEVRANMASGNAWLQMGYLIVALRAVGLSVAPMNGMDADAVDAELFPGTGHHAFALLNVGYADGDGGAYPRAPRLSFDEAATII